MASTYPEISARCAAERVVHLRSLRPDRELQRSAPAYTGEPLRLCLEARRQESLSRLRRVLHTVDSGAYPWTVRREVDGATLVGRATRPPDVPGPTPRLWGWEGDTVNYRSRREALRHRPLVGARWSDGRLAGVRAFHPLGGGHLASPFFGTWWEPGGTGRPMLEAERWTAKGAVRNEVGIHALWPRKSGSTDKIAPCWSAPYVIALVAGWGDYVAGAAGWRAERCEVLEVVEIVSRDDESASPSAAERVFAMRGRYPGLTIRTPEGGDDSGWATG